MKEVDSNCYRREVLQDFRGDNADVVEIARELELEVDSKDVTELQFHDKTLMDELFFMDEQRKWFLEMEFLVKMNIVETTTKDLEYYNSLDKAAAGFERIDSNFKRSSTMNKQSNNIACYREIFCKSKSQSMWQTSLLSYLKKLSATQIFSNTTLI